MLSKIIFNGNTEKTFKYGMFGIREIQYTGLPALKFEYNNYGGNTRIFTDNQDVSIEKNIMINILIRFSFGIIQDNAENQNCIFSAK